jgi:RES domain-containing protein
LIEAFRITPEPDPARAFSGEGSKNWGGRWNSMGVSMVYTAATRALATLEILVHMRGAPGAGSARRPYLIYQISFDEALLEQLSETSLPAGWNAEPPTDASQRIGDAWVSAAGSPVLSVPSVIVRGERNYLLNPNHRRFPEIKIGAAVACHFDPRLL